MKQQLEMLHAAVLSVLCVASCGGEKVYVHPTKHTAYEFDSDLSACKAQAVSSTTYQGNPFIAASQNNDIVNLCLEGKGWRQTRVARASTTMMGVGGGCESHTDCTGSLVCAEGRCRPASTAGEQCANDGECIGALTCVEGKCVGPKT